MKPMPASLTQRPTCSGLRSILTPSEASTSAAPERDDNARLPCLATGTPVPATMKEAQVETLTEPDPSPPVPTMSTASAGATTGSILARIADTAPVISSTVSPRTRSAIKSPPICEGVASPDIRLSKAAADSSRVSVAPVATFPIIDLRSSIAYFRDHSVAAGAGHLREGFLVDGGADLLFELGHVKRNLLVAEATHQLVLQLLHVLGIEVDLGVHDIGDAEDQPFGAAGARCLSGAILGGAEGGRDQPRRHAGRGVLPLEAGGLLDLRPDTGRFLVELAALLELL